MRLIPSRNLIALARRRHTGRDAEETVQPILEAVRRRGDRALLEMTRRYDHVELKALRISQEELLRARKSLPEGDRKALLAAADRVRRFHERQMPRPFTLREPGCRLTFRFCPIRTVGIHVPGGQAPLVSSLLMSAVPAQVAGVKNIVVCSPPSFRGGIRPEILGALSLLGIRDVFPVGGAQAVAAMAYGTETIPAVDKIVGPGNRFVNAAKKLLSGEVGIDILAGPSEVVVFSDGTGRPDFIAADLNAQMEHTDGTGIFVTTSRGLGRKVSALVKSGLWTTVRDDREALEVINAVAPEHLQVICANPEMFERGAVAGAVFIGEYSPTALGDYFAGPSHTLPTSGTARFSSGISVFTFLRSYAVIEGTRSFLARNGTAVAALARMEGLAAHTRSVQIRISANSKPGRKR